MGSVKPVCFPCASCLARPRVARAPRCGHFTLFYRETTHESEVITESRIRGSQTDAFFAIGWLPDHYPMVGNIGGGPETPLTLGAEAQKKWPLSSFLEKH